jgi:cytochrome c oxidase subunit 5b
MHRIAARAPLRALFASTRTAAVSRRAFSVTARARSGGAEPIVVGKGSDTGKVPTSAEQATGNDRLQVLGEMEGYDFFDMEPLYIDRMGTLKEPILVKTFGVRTYIYLNIMN